MAPHPLQSNWSATLEARLGFEPSQIPGDSEAARDDDKHGEDLPGVGPDGIMSMDMAALVLGIDAQGVGWRRRVMRRIRSEERKSGLEILVVNVGRRGSHVRAAPLLKVAPLQHVIKLRFDSLAAEVRTQKKSISEIRAQLRATERVLSEVVRRLNEIAR
ncbi:hypothetical protein [Polyangium fumosum]|uniref:Uncharacterized protein n=1 Tax=Polyangium fumosum TaxID=889272 RepID=A0A4U1IUV4_9BACT|nr:hypothetical protein [Polyangium fumosum]TKC98187.1 hypothetical protein E8A74_42430 [Polyangium fumosum]